MPAKRKANSNAEPVSNEGKIARLLAFQAIRTMENNIDKAVFLRSAGFTNPEIASLLNISHNQVAVAFVQSRKKKKKKKKSQ